MGEPMITYRHTFNTETEANRYAKELLNRYHPDGYGTTVRVVPTCSGCGHPIGHPDPHLNQTDQYTCSCVCEIHPRQFVVKGHRYESCD